MKLFKSLLLFSMLWTVLGNYVLASYNLQKLDNLIDDQKTNSFYKEEIEYDINYLGVKVGSSILKFHGKRKLKDKEVYFITFRTNLPFLKDTENIYVDTENFLPLQVVRDIKKVGFFPKKIYEEYDQKNFSVFIQEKSVMGSKEYTIKKEQPLNNVILLVYICRILKNIEVGQEFKVNLPTVEFNVKVDRKEKINSHIGEQETYVFKSNPDKFTFWLSVKDRIPIRMDGMIIKGYSLEIRRIKGGSKTYP